MTQQQNRIAPVLMMLFALDGCALTSKADATMPRYFTPDFPQNTRQLSAGRSIAELRIGRVTAGSYLREKMVYRDSSYEVGFYDDRLWTERPDAYLRRALNQVLFEENGLRGVVSGAALVLDVELLNFEELRQPAHAALVRLTFALRDEKTVRVRRTLTVQAPVEPAAKAQQAPAAVAMAFGQALRRAVDETWEQVAQELAAPSVSPAPAPR